MGISAENHKTVKQAKILSGSKILVSKVPSGSPKINSSHLLFSEGQLFQPTNQPEKKNEHLEKKLVEIGAKSAELETTLGALEEELDQVQLSDQERELRAKRKMAATRLNNALDRIDSLKERLCGAIRRCS